MELKIKALSPKIGTEIPLPRFATAGAACMDLCACIDEVVTLAAGERRLVPTGIAIALPSADYAALVFARSGLGIKKGVCLSNGVGVIDSDYRGEIHVGLANHGDQPYTVHSGERIAQMLFKPALFFAKLLAPQSQFLWRYLPIEASAVAHALLLTTLDEPQPASARIIEGLRLHHPIFVIGGE